MEKQLHHGRGAVNNPGNKFSQQNTAIYFAEGVDDFEVSSPKTTFASEYPQKIISKNTSPDIPFNVSVNPYQGCEHGCVYCYARETHQFWGLSAGLDFESKILVKKNAPELLEKAFLNPRWQVEPVMFSGNTDCYQPGEKQHKLTRKLLEVCLRFRNPVSIITKNALILRDLDILKELAHHKLVKVMISVTTLNDKLRRELEPRTVSGSKRLATVTRLSDAGVPAGVMIAPVIPGLNMSEVPSLVEQSAKAGAMDVGYSILRLNGKIASIFSNWLKAVYPGKADKILNQVQSTHGGQVNDSRFMKRMLGEGQIAGVIGQLFRVAREQHFTNPGMPEFDTSKFRRGGMYTIW